MAEIANQDAQILAQMDSLEADAKQYPMIGAIEKIGPTLLPEYKEAASPGFIPGIEYLDAKYPKGKYQSFPPLSSLSSSACVHQSYLTISCICQLTSQHII